MNTVQKTINEEEQNFDKFLEKIELTYFDNKYSDDEKDNKKHEQILKDLIENKKASELCRGSIDDGYIEETFLDIDIMGYVAKIKGEYAGFILFKKPNEDYNELYLSLVATKAKTGMPLGQILISVMEEVAKETNIHTIIADSVEGALNFYKKNDWEVLQKDDDDETYLIEKQIREKTQHEIEQQEEEEEEEDLFSDYTVDLEDFNFEEYMNRDIDDELEDSESYFQKVLNYTYSFFG